MADTLQRIKNRLKIDQTNLASGEVLSINSSKATIRLRDGRQRTAYLPDGVSIGTGDTVQISLDGAVATVQGAAKLQQLAGEKVVEL